MRSREPSQRNVSGSDERADAGQEPEPTAPPMAVSIAGVSRACSKDALVSSAKATREALSAE